MFVTCSFVIFVFLLLKKLATLWMMSLLSWWCELLCFNQITQSVRHVKFTINYNRELSFTKQPHSQNVIFFVCFRLFTLMHFNMWLFFCVSQQLPTNTTWRIFSLSRSESLPSDSCFSLARASFPSRWIFFPSSCLDERHISELIAFTFVYIPLNVATN